MKKLFITFSITVLLFCSCTNNETNDVKNSETKISAVLNEKNYDTQKIIYRMLSSEDRLRIWQNKIDNMILNDGLNNEQINLIEDLKSNLTAEIFDEKENNDAREIFNNVYTKEFFKKSKHLFDLKYIASNFYTLNSRVSYELSEIKCTCHQGSSISCPYDFYCGTWSGEPCESSSSGCGWIWLQSCNGNCRLSGN